MNFLASAVLLATLCAPERDCRTEEIAQFGQAEAGPIFCQGLSEQLNSLPNPDGMTQFYFCLPPASALKLVSD